jgi:hypothetical protein
LAATFHQERLSPPLIAPNLSISPLTVTATADKVVTRSTSGRQSDRSGGVSTSGSNQFNQGKMVPVSGGPDRSERIFFSPPPGGPPKVAQLPETSGTGNIAGTNLADHPFRGSILDTGLSKPSNSKSTDQPIVSVSQVYVPSIVPIGQGPQGPPTLDTMSKATTLPMFKGVSASGSPGGG